MCRLADDAVTTDISSRILEALRKAQVTGRNRTMLKVGVSGPAGREGAMHVTSEVAFQTHRITQQVRKSDGGDVRIEKSLG